ncbi:MAG: hypothetical protein J5699_06265 [Bacteroidales bacterium]|nr:hypothetical protein [Bacteroidales bacterium]
MNLDLMIELLVPIGVCVVLPIMVVWMVMRNRQNETNRKAEIMLKAIESGSNVDLSALNTEPVKKVKTVKQQLLGRLTGACVTSLLGVAMIVASLFTSKDPSFFLFDAEDMGGMVMMGSILIAIGIALFIVYFVGKKMLSKEIEAEEKALREDR